MDLHEAENKLWEMLDKHDKELASLQDELSKEKDLDRLFRAYLMGVVKTRKNVVAAITEAYVDEKDEE